MKLHLALPALFAALLLQTTLLLSMGAVHLRPDLLLLFVVGVGVVAGVSHAVIWSAAAGLLLDLMSAAPLGTHMMALLPVALLTLLRQSDIIEGRLTLSLALVFIATFVYDTIFLAMIALTGQRVEWLPSLFWVMLTSAVLNTAVMPPVYWVIRRTALSVRWPNAYETA